MKKYKSVCGRSLKECLLEFEGFRMPGWKCPKCGEELLNPLFVDAVRKIKN